MERSGSKIGSSALDILSVRYLSDSHSWVSLELMKDLMRAVSLGVIKNTGDI